MNLNYKSYWRKTGLKGKWGNIFLNKLEQHNPKNVLEIGVFCGVTARNICDFLNNKNGNDFNYIGIDLFGSDQNVEKDEIAPTFLKDQKFSNPLKNIYYNHILKENLNSIKSVNKLLKKYPNHKLAAKTQYLIGDIYMNDLRDFNNAINFYIIEKSDLLKNKYKYSDLSYLIIQEFIENHYNQNVDQIIHELMFRKLGI